MIRKLIVIGGTVAVAAGAPLTALAATRGAGPAAVPVAATCTGDQQRLHLHDGSGDGLQIRAGAPAAAVQGSGGLGYATGPQDGTGQQHQGSPQA